jgi:hypothetical protein
MEGTPDCHAMPAKFMQEDENHAGVIRDPTQGTGIYGTL